MSYVKHFFEDGQVLNAEQLNDIENGLVEVESGVPTQINSAMANVVADQFSTIRSYQSGDYVIKDGVMYMFISAHAAGAWNSSEVAPVKLANELKLISQNNTMGLYSPMLTNHLEQTPKTVYAGTSIQKAKWLDVEYNKGDTFLFWLTEQTDGSGTGLAQYAIRYWKEGWADGLNISGTYHVGNVYKVIAPEDIINLGIYVGASNVGSNSTIVLHTCKVVNNQKSLNGVMESSMASVETETASKPYSSNRLLIKDGILYRTTGAISAGGALVEGTNLERITADERFANQRDVISPMRFVYNSPVDTLRAGIDGKTQISRWVNVPIQNNQKFTVTLVTGTPEQISSYDLYCFKKNSDSPVQLQTGTVPGSTMLFTADEAYTGFSVYIKASNVVADTTVMLEVQKYEVNLAALSNSIAPGEHMLSLSNHSIGELVMRNGELFKVTNSIVSGDQITNSNAQKTSVAGELTSLRNSLSLSTGTIQQSQNVVTGGSGNYIDINVVASKLYGYSYGEANLLLRFTVNENLPENVDIEFGTIDLTPVTTVGLTLVSDDGGLCTVYITSGGVLQARTKSQLSAGAYYACAAFPYNTTT